jgi:A/G-specific adenine glycosylase
MLNPDPDLRTFALRIVQWQRQQGRHHLPWQGSRDPYRIWLSEIMLQQTQVETVKGYYARFLERFPTLHALGTATLDDVMPYWAGLGYYTRARNLHRCAADLVEKWNGAFPGTAGQIATLPGIGRSTAAAIAAFAFGERSPIMDGNVKRVFTRYFGIEGQTAATAVEKKLWQLAEDALEQAPADLNMAAYTQGLMDLGATCCTRSKPTCLHCPLQESCYARSTCRQHDLPTPKARKATPQRECALLIVQHEHSVLLQKQPSPGIWGGLLSLPRYDDSQALLQACALLAPTATPLRMAGFQHVFSHFRLNIEPWLVQTSHGVTEPLPDQHWLPLQALDTAALPAPVKKLLLGVRQLQT